MLWKPWWELVCELRSACARTRSFLGMAVCLAGMTTRQDLMGVTSLVRGLGRVPACYDRLLDFFHRPALDLNKLTRTWRDLVFRVHPDSLRVGGKPVLVGDGIKVAKGRASARKNSYFTRVFGGKPCAEGRFLSGMLPEALVSRVFNVRWPWLPRPDGRCPV